MTNFPEGDLKILVGDIGGTNVRLQLLQTTKQNKQYANVKELKSASYKTWDHPEFKNFLDQFLEGQKVHLAVIAIAGPIQHNTVIMANTEWPKVDANALSEQYGFKILLINDFQAVAYGILGLNQNDLIPMNKGVPKPSEPIIVLGPGTGLGVCRLFPSTVNGETRYQVWPCEGGHVHYSPSNDLETEYLQYLRSKLKFQHIVAEKAMAGPAIPYIYNFLKLKFPSDSVIEKDIDPKRFSENSGNDFPSKEVYQYGIGKKDPLCQKVVDFFINSYGTVVGDLICNALPYSGIYLFGSISVSVAPYILENPQVNFLQQYVKDRPHLQQAFNQIPIYVIKKEDLGLEGAYQAAYRVMESDDINVKL